MADESKRQTHSFHNVISDEKAQALHVEEVVINRITEDDLMTMSRKALKFWSRTGLRLCWIMFVQGCNQAGYGVDWSVVGNINSFKTWHNYFHVPSSGSQYGTIVALMQIGMVCGAPFLGLSDMIGRRGINFVGNFFVLFGSLLQGFANNLAMFMAGRFFLGFGAGLMSTPQYIAEITPVHLRGRMVGFFGACFQIGSVAMGAGMIGFTTMTSNWGWRIPFILEGLFPLIVCITVYTTPESPRFLIQAGHREKARQVIAKYHTNSNDVNEPIVTAVVAQIEESLETSRTGFRDSWDYRVFLTKPVRFRLLVLVLYSFFQQWNGGGIISYYLTPALETIGIKNSIDQIGINLGLTAIYFVFTMVGSFLVDLMRRRTLIFLGLGTMIAMQVAATITSWQYNETGSKATSALTLLWIFMYQIFSSSFVATMHNLYPVEILSLPLRAKGMGLYNLIQGGAGAAQSYGISVGIQKIGYKIWVVYIVYNTLQLVASYFVFPETSKLNLEEIDAVFETPGVHPVKMSLMIQNAKKERVEIEREHGDVTHD